VTLTPEHACDGEDAVAVGLMPPAGRRPDFLYWLLQGGTVLNSILSPWLDRATPPKKVQEKCARRGYIPHGATHFREHPDCPWRPLHELPESWGLKTVMPSAAPELPAWARDSIHRELEQERDD
jgi:hypothetical protein